MKKHRILALLLAMAMIVTYMPVIAFAAPDKTGTVKAEKAKSEKLNKMQGKTVPDKKAAQETKKSLSAQDMVEPEEEATDWSVNSDELKCDYDEEVTITAEIESETEPEGTPQYVWYIYDNDEWEWMPVEDYSGFDVKGNSCSFTYTGEVHLACVVTIGKEGAVGHYDVFTDDGLPFDTASGWRVKEYDQKKAVGDTVTINAEPEADEDGEVPEGEATYQWYKDVGEDEWVSIDEDFTINGKSCTFTFDGYINLACAVTIGEETSIGKFCIEEDNGLPVDNADEWYLNDEEEGFRSPYKAKVEIIASIGGDKPEGDPVYEWYKEAGDRWEKIEDGDSVFTVDGNTCSFILTEETVLTCAATIGTETATCRYCASIDTNNYDYVVANPNAKATYTTADGQKPEINYTTEETYFPEEGDIITITSNGKSDKYTCTSVEGEDDNNLAFINADGEEVYLEWDEDWDVDVKNQKVKLNICTAYEDNHEKKQSIKKYDIYTTIDAKITSDIKSMQFSPSKFTVDVKDVKGVTEDGDTYYDFENRYKYVNEYGDKRNSAFADGDKVTVTYYDGKKVTYTFDKNDRSFVYKYVDDDGYDNTDYFDPCFYDSSVKVGNNTLVLWKHGISTTINVSVKDAAAEAKAKAEAEAKAKAAAAAAEAKAKATTTVTINSKTVNASTIAAAITAAGGKTQYVKSFVIGKNVKKISAKAFKGTNITTLTIKSKKLKKKSVKKSLKGSKVKTVKVKVGNKKTNKKFVKKYKKIFTKKNAGKKVKVK